MSSFVMSNFIIIPKRMLKDLNKFQQIRTNKAFSELGLILDSNQTDRLQLQRIIFDIIAYPVVQNAIIHQKTQMLGLNDLIQKQQSLQNQIKMNVFPDLKLCQCCGLLQQQQNLPYLTNLNNLNLGIGVKLYFTTVWFHTFIFMVALLIYSIYSFITNIIVFYNDSNLENTFCLINQNCGLSKLGTGSKASVNSDYSKILGFIQGLLGIILIILWSLIHIYRVHSEKNLKIQMQTKRISASAFTLMLTNYPKYYLFEKTQAEILQSVQEQFKKYASDVGSQFQYHVSKVNVARPLYNQQAQQKQKKAIIQQKMKNRLDVFRSWIHYRTQYTQFPTSSQRRDQQYENYIQFFSEVYDLKEIHDVNLDEKNILFVTIESSKAKEEIAINNTPSFSNMYLYFSKLPVFKIQGVDIKAAPQPQQIIWENIGFQYNKKLVRKLFIYLIALILICVSFCVSLGLSYYQSQQKNSNVSIAISIVITLVAFLIDYAIYYLSFLENQFNKTAQQASIAFKIAISQVLNCIGVPLAVTFIVPGKKVFAQGGLVSDVFYIGLLNILTPIGRFVDPWNIYLILRRFYFSRPNSRLYIHGQKKLNQQFANYEMDLGYQYGFVIKTVFFTSFFLCLQPLIALFAPIALFGMYMVNKYRLFYRFHRPKFFTFEVNEAVDWLLNLGPIVFAVGQLFILNWLNYDDDPTTQQLNYWPLSITNYLGISIAGLLYFFPFKICYYCGLQEPKLPHWHYQQKRALIPTDYDRSNPITKDRAIYEFKDYLQDLDKKQQLPNSSQFLLLSLIRQNKVNNQKSNLKISTRSNFFEKPLSHSINFRGEVERPNYVQDLSSYEVLLKYTK